MALVRFAPLGLEGSSQEDETILDVARRAGAPIGNSCGGVGWCARCRVRIVGGAAGSLGAPTWIEQEKGAELAFGADERLACQATVKGDVKVTTTYWGPLR
jgi:ferredoxin